MPDNTYGKIELQTPEIVKLKVPGGAILTYPTLDFVAASPHNLSEGFGLFVNFGVDYQLQTDITTNVSKQLENYLQKALTESIYSADVVKACVEFEEAGASSLNLVIIVFFSGQAAERYYPIKRFLQTIAVNACNKHDWVIPFQQVTVHMEPTKY